VSSDNWFGMLPHIFCTFYIIQNIFVEILFKKNVSLSTLSLLFKKYVLVTCKLKHDIFIDWVEENICWIRIAYNYLLEV
jgi:hypothetical protein